MYLLRQESRGGRLRPPFVGALPFRLPSTSWCSSWNGEHIGCLLGEERAIQLWSSDRRIKGGAVTKSANSRGLGVAGVNISSALVLCSSVSLGGVIAYIIHAAKCLGVSGLESMSRPGLAFRERLLIGLLMCGYLVILVAAIVLLAYIATPATRIPAEVMSLLS